MFTETNSRRYTGQQPATKSARGPAVKPLVNRASTACQPLVFPGHALHEKGLQRQIAVSTLVNSQQRRALAVPRLNRWSTAGQPLVNRLFCSLSGLHRISFVRACEETFRTVVKVPWRDRGTVAFEADRNVGTLVCPASPRATVRCALRRPDPPVVCPGFGLDRSKRRRLNVSPEARTGEIL